VTEVLVCRCGECSRGMRLDFEAKWRPRMTTVFNERDGTGVFIFPAVNGVRLSTSSPVHTRSIHLVQGRKELAK
jgi:hypothetical protein